MNYAIEMLEKLRDSEKIFWTSHAESLAYGGEKESTLKAYNATIMRLVQLEESLAILKGNPWSTKDILNYIHSLEDEKYQKRKEYIESITNSPFYKMFLNASKEDSTTAEDES